MKFNGFMSSGLVIDISRVQNTFTFEVYLYPNPRIFSRVRWDKVPYGIMVWMF